MRLTIYFNSVMIAMSLFTLGLTACDNPEKFIHQATPKVAPVPAPTNTSPVPTPAPVPSPYSPVPQPIPQPNPTPSPQQPIVTNPFQPIYFPSTAPEAEPTFGLALTWWSIRLLDNPLFIMDFKDLAKDIKTTRKIRFGAGIKEILNNKFNYIPYGTTANILGLRGSRSFIPANSPFELKRYVHDLMFKAYPLTPRNLWDRTDENEGLKSFGFFKLFFAVDHKNGSQEGLIVDCILVKPFASVALKAICPVAPTELTNFTKTNSDLIDFKWRTGQIIKGLGSSERLGVVSVETNSDGVSQVFIYEKNHDFAKGPALPSDEMEKTTLSDFLSKTNINFLGLPEVTIIQSNSYSRRTFAQAVGIIKTESVDAALYNPLWHIVVSNIPVGTFVTDKIRDFPFDWRVLPVINERDLR